MQGSFLRGSAPARALKKFTERLAASTQVVVRSFSFATLARKASAMQFDLATASRLTFCSNPGHDLST